MDLAFPRTVDLSAALEVGGRVAVILALTAFALLVLHAITRRVEKNFGNAGPSADSLQQQHLKTITGLIRGAGVVVIVLISLLMTLQAAGINIGPILAGAGVLGLAISFGAQSLVRDIISGLFMLSENQFGVGDVISVGEVGGVVEKFTLRVVVLRDVHGVVHTVPNGEIKRVSNMTRSWSRVVLDVGVAYREEVDRVIEVMEEVGRELWDDPEWRPLLVEEVTVPGVEGFGDSSVNIRLMAKTVPLKQWEVARELRRRIKNRFDQEGIEIPFPHLTLQWEGEGKGV
ncbi:MAG: mechanosensitive ion channel family protein [Longimicrobiaceae bacterium]